MKSQSDKSFPQWLNWEIRLGKEGRHGQFVVGIDRGLIKGKSPRSGRRQPRLLFRDERVTVDRWQGLLAVPVDCGGAKPL